MYHLSIEARSHQSETVQLKVLGETFEELEKKIINERTTLFKLDPSISDEKAKASIQAKFVGESALTTTKELLEALKIEKIENETINDYNSRIMKNVKSILEFNN